MNNNVVEANAEAKSGFFSRIKTGLSRTRSKLAAGMGRVLLGEKAIDSNVLEEIETILLTSDVGVAATNDIVASLTGKISRNELANAQALFDTLQVEMTSLLLPVEQPLVIPEQEGPFVILMVGVNGAGKTTTIGKLAKRFQEQGKSVLLAAGDTYRAAAVEQLKVWGERNNVPVIAQATGADSASVIYDALDAARSRGVDVLIADTAGRLQSKKNLMDELAKIRRVMNRLDDNAPHEVMLVLDATTGQNAISQAQEFRSVVDVSGIAITKLDGTAKGGVVFAIAKQLAIPIRFIGVGEKVDDLRPFEAESFVRAIFAKDDDGE
ncbi:MAG: signal recognition particle-docking protein FtsY [SAR86 cluster bacterium]|jgi:fused signal recognition particle receptor|uniref:Signal recognition particle receptor FtsY n=1 Tax=SAR86 cluster bacterium TaxID=2030880 RepID=A0A972VX17_9GAMM|nr:signal recognition particle-docking protein FtsY [SAR86 cluster bacterium]